MFRKHRDYLLAVARELEVTDMVKPLVEEEVRRSSRRMEVFQCSIEGRQSRSA